mmetsp:Transcript_30260/g.85334  ORF Transcript_30260/g.85334 Transcript_30260/m.85334 type:complete len:275 (+) Transcript_30260:350-1174(+)
MAGAARGAGAAYVVVAVVGTWEDWSCGRIQLTRFLQHDVSSATMLASSCVTMCSCSNSSSTDGVSLNFTVLTVGGWAMRSVAVCAASISAGESPRTMRFMPPRVCLRPASTSRNVSRFHAKTSPGKLRSYFRRADTTLICCKMGKTRGAKRRVLSSTHSSSAFVTMDVSPSFIDVVSICSSSASSCCAWCSCSWLLLIAVLHMSVSSQSKMMTMSWSAPIAAVWTCCRCQSYDVDWGTNALDNIDAGWPPKLPPAPGPWSRCARYVALAIGEPP